MELTHGFTLPASVGQAWTAFYFPNRIAPCFPGATLGRVDGDYFDGVLKIKLGPMPVEYKGTATFLERSPENQRIVVQARGEDARGRGAITATVAMTFTQTESGTEVDSVSDVTLTGQAASFGKTVLQEVSDRLVQRLVGCVSGKFATGLGDPPAAEELAMARPAKPAVSPDSTEQTSPPVPAPVPQDTAEQATPPAPQPVTAEPDHEVEILTTEPTDEETEHPPTTTTEPTADETEHPPTTTTEPTADETEHPPTTTTEPTADETEHPPTTTTEPTADETEHPPTTTTEPTADETEHPPTTTTEPTADETEHPPTTTTDSATTVPTDGTPEPARSAPVSETPEPSSGSVATAALPRLRRYRAPVVGAVVLAAAIGVLRRMRR